MRWKWDRWRFSSGDAGFRIAAGFEYHPAPVKANGCDPGWCAGGPRFALDLDGSRDQVAAQAGVAWDLWHGLSRSLPQTRSDPLKRTAGSRSFGRSLHPPRYRDDYVVRQRNRVKRPSGLVTVDGWWWEPGEPPVHGVCDGPAVCPHRFGVSDVDGYLEGLPSDTVIVSLICHV